MILRKPYAVFIKYFRLLHAVMAVFSGVLLYRIWSLYTFFKVYSVDYRAVMNNFSVSSYLSSFDFIIVFASFILAILLLSVMLYKDKPKYLYIYSILVFFAIIILFFLCDSTLSQTLKTILDIKVSKAFRDLFLIVFGALIVVLVLFSIRAIGFDIKKFDFGSDLQQLDISESDSEEIEVAVDFDRDKLSTALRRNFRNLKYVYIENKFVINTASVIIISLLSFLIYSRITAYYEVYKEGKTFSINGFEINVVDSFVADSNYLGSKLVDNDAAIVVVRYQMSGSSKDEFDTGFFNLKIGDLSYSQNIDLAKGLKDIGNVFFDQAVTENFKTYIIAFEVSKSQTTKKMSLKCNDTFSFVGNKAAVKNIYVRLKPRDLRGKNSDTIKNSIGDRVDFNDSILNSSHFKVDSFEIGNKFKLSYNYCYRGDKCIDSAEFLTPTFTGNYFKTLMKISGKFAVDKTLNNAVAYDMRTFLNRYGIIHYKIDGEWYKKRVSSQSIVPTIAKTDDIFIEIPLEVGNASEIYFTFEIYNQIYKYSLK
ncbi:MAG: hypothetical protein IKF82_08310 [Bacilli bacterium]|nr:hypothetical protein [Bacilli bacterium]